MADTKRTNSKLFTPINIGPYTLSHRIVMAPMTRNRGLPFPEESSPAHPPVMYRPTSLHAEYYSQRATEGGLIITEGTHVSSQAGSMPGVPGLFHESHREGWRDVVQHVHAKGGVFFAQLWHAGRFCVPQFTGMRAVSSSAKEWVGEDHYLFPDPITKAKINMREFPPEELDGEGVRRVIGEYVDAAIMAVKECGFDGVEVHAGNGYLVDQFLHDNINCTRGDKYGGGTVEGRTRFALELIEALAKGLEEAGCGKGKLSIRIEPFGVLYGMKGSKRREVWGHLCEEIGRNLKDSLAYVHFVEARPDQIKSMLSPEEQVAFWQDVNPDGSGEENVASLGTQQFRAKLNGIPTISCGGNDGDNAVGGRVDKGEADMLAFARWFLSTPDLVERLMVGRGLNAYDRRTMYGWGATDDMVRRKGYTDYPTWTGSKEFEELQK